MVSKIFKSLNSYAKVILHIMACPDDWADLRDIIHCNARPQIMLIETIVYIIHILRQMSSLF
jgi:hypothetical protein